MSLQRLTDANAVMLPKMLTREATYRMMTPPATDNNIDIAFLGNSILYFNDCPRVLESMLESKYARVTQNSCLRGGASLKELWVQGNGMATKFASGTPRENGTYDIGASSVQALLGHHSWDFCVLNDFTQGPARHETRQESKIMLDRCYAPLFEKCGAVPIVIQTAAYRKPVRNTQDLGTVEQWTKRLYDGCNEYVRVLEEALPDSQTPRLAPVGNAIFTIYNDNRELWNKLFYTDDFHPSPHGTYLQACVLYCVIVNEAPPMYDPAIWNKCRYMQRVNKQSLPLPTLEEAAVLREYACQEFGIGECN
jgi:hypothetical protein